MCKLMYDVSRQYIMKFECTKSKRKQKRTEGIRAEFECSLDLFIKMVNTE